MSKAKPKEVICEFIINGKLIAKKIEHPQHFFPSGLFDADSIADIYSMTEKPQNLYIRFSDGSMEKMIKILDEDKIFFMRKELIAKSIVSRVKDINRIAKKYSETSIDLCLGTQGPDDNIDDNII